MDRRHFIQRSAGLSLSALIFGTGSPEALANKPATSEGSRGRRRIPWQNWSGFQKAEPAGRASPKNEDELAELLKNASQTIRPVGAGHSFTPLVPTDGTILSLRHFNGLKGHDADDMTATFGAGTKISQVGEPLNALGQMLGNMPDIDEQTLAGAMNTGTHGTGEKLGALHSYVSALTLVTPTGDVLRCSKDDNAEVFDAARVSLGALGVVTDYTLKNLPATRLKRRSWIMPLDDIFDQFDELAANNHSFEFYYIPFSDMGMAITINPTDDPVSPPRIETDNDSVEQLRQLRDYLGWWPGLRRWLMNMAAKDLPAEETVDIWYKVFPSERAVRFNEMEYHMDREHLIPTMKKVRDRIEQQHHEVYFPCEIRVVNGIGDDAMLSPFYQHHSASIAIHRYFEDDPLPYFASIEPLYQDIGGRPHWGKMHNLDSATLASRYPRWQEFQDIRRELDPKGTMLNAHLRHIFGA